MKTTKHYQLKLPESGDALSLTPFNDNAQTIDTALHANNQKIIENTQAISASQRDTMQAVEAVRQETAQNIQSMRQDWTQTLANRTVMACGSYRGDGTKSRTIQTLGFQPQVVLMRTKGDSLDCGLYNYQGMAVKEGWCLWMGEDISTDYGIIHFTATDGSLSWSLSSEKPIAATAMNNGAEQNYQWVAFGTAQS